MAAKYLLIVIAEVDPEVEADWSRWYDNVHLRRCCTDRMPIPDNARREVG